MAKKKIEKIDRANPEVEQFDGASLNRKFHQTMKAARDSRNISVNIAEAAEEYACLFGANKNVYRVMPSMQDGLRPGKRRIFYSLWQLCGKPQKASPEVVRRLKKDLVKLDRLMGATSAIHPHGGATYETIVGEGQTFRNNICTIAKQGNYGNINGEAPGSSRYISAGMSEYLVDCFFDDYDSACIPLKPTYDGKGMEPEYLPAKYPHVLFNPQFSGIGYGRASNIPPFNIQEVLEAVIKLIKNPDAKIMLIPDFVFGVNIVDNGQFKEINKTGNGQLMVQGEYSVDPIQNTIHIKSLPLNVFSRPYIEKLAIKCQKGGPMEGKIVEIRNNTTETEVDITLVLNKDINPDEIVEYLLKSTELRTTHSVSLKMIDDYVEYEYGVKTFLKDWIDFRRDTIRYMYNYKLVHTLDKQHMNDAMLLVLKGNNVHETVKICKDAKNTAEAVTNLMQRYGITSLQAKTISDMRLSQFNKETYDRYKELKKSCEEDLKRIREILSSDDKIDEIIIEQMEEGIKKYGHPRRSKIISLNEEPDIPDTKYLVGISKSGYIKKLKAKTATVIGQVGKDNRNVTILEIGNRDAIIIVSADGTISKIPVSSIPDMKVEDIGIEIKRYFSGNGDVVAILKAPTKKEEVSMGDHEFLMITKMGYAKRTPYSDMVLKQGKAQKIISLNEGDELTRMILVTDPKLDIVICTSMGNGVRLPISEIKQISKAGKGQRVIEMKIEEDITDLCIINPKMKHLVYITSAGKMKLSELKYFPPMQKRDHPIPLITLDAMERLIGVASVAKGDVIKVFGRKGGNDYDPIGVSSIPVRSRISKGERVVKLPRGEAIIGFKIFRA